MDTLEEERTRFFKAINTAKGTHCACCDRYGKKYSMRISRVAMQLLSTCFDTGAIEGMDKWRTCGELFYLKGYHKPSLSTGNFHLLRHWGLTIGRLEMNDIDAETWDIKGAGWQITPKGIAFLRRELAVPKYAYIYNKQLYGFSDELVYCEQAHRTGFDLEEMKQEIINNNEH